MLWEETSETTDDAVEPTDAVDEWLNDENWMIITTTVDTTNDQHTDCILNS